MSETLDIATPRRRSVLPIALQSSLEQLGESLRAGQAPQPQVNAVVTGLSRLSPEIYSRASREIVQIGQLYHRYPPKRTVTGTLLTLFRPTPTESELLSQTPGLEYLYVFHRNGRLREGALVKIDGALESAFFVSSIADRFNDWADPVREAAQACAARTFPKTPPHIIAASAFVLLERMHHWQRWGRRPPVLEQTLARPDVAEHLARLIGGARAGRVGRILRSTLRDAWMDRHLLDLSREAAQPAVRAVALKSLIAGKASWPDGFETQWIDKSLGRSRRVIAFGHRVLDRPVPLEDLIARGAADPSALVRRVAADGLVQYRRALRDLDFLVQKFAMDPTESVRERALFILNEGERERASETSPKAS